MCIMEKQCSKCMVIKDIENFHKKVSGKHGRNSFCKTCDSNRCLNYRHTKDGLITKIFKLQKTNSKMKGNEPPSYTKTELYKWLFDQSLFHELFDDWVKSGYDKMITPSVDRKDDYKSYTLDNVQLMTWQENFDKGHYNRRNGINNKASRAVLQYDLNGKFIKEYYSIIQVQRETGINSSSISSACRRKTKTSGGFTWRYKNK